MPRKAHFNPRTREGCDWGTLETYGGKLVISIHAPVKGATADTPAKSFKDDLISIHAPVKGATLDDLYADGAA